MEQALLDSLRLIVEHGPRHHGTAVGQYGAWAVLIAAAVALTRFEKVLEILGRLFGRKNGNGETRIMRANGAPCPMHEGLVADVKNLVDMAEKHHAEQREDMREIRTLLMKDRG